MATWTLKGRTANLATGRLAARLDLDRPGRGLFDLDLSGTPLAGNVLGVELGQGLSAESTTPGEPSLVDDAYIRGDDLVAVYGQSPASPYRVQVYWRGVSPGVARPVLAAVDLIASVQTPLLDSRPELQVDCTLSCEGGSVEAPSESLFRMTTNTDEPPQPIELAASGAVFAAEDEAAGFLVRPPGANYSCAALIHPDDWQGAAISLDESGVVRLAFSLFARFLEKGVILRSRLRCVFLDRAGDAEAAAIWLGDLSLSKLPLTA